MMSVFSDDESFIHVIMIFASYGMSRSHDGTVSWMMEVSIF